MRLDMRLLAIICGQFGSEHEAVRASAARKADEMLKAAGRTWEDVLHATPAPPARPRATQAPEPPDARPAPEQARPPRRMSGDDIPHVVIGSISVFTDDNPLTIVVSDGDTEWGPIAVRGIDLTATAREGGFRMRRVSVHHRGSGGMPEAHRII